MEYLVVLEVSQKQSYIFKSNRLAENIGASILIRDITEVLPEQMVEKLAQERQEKAELVLKGGGKSIYAFASEEGAQEFTRRVSRTVLEQYPGVELFMATHAYSEREESVVDTVNELYGKLEKKKSGREASFRLYDLGITKQCESTQLPAVAVNDRGLPVSAESKAKLDAAKKHQNEMFAQLLPDTVDKKYRFASKFEELGVTKNSKSYIAIVSLDGNRMGKKIEKFRDDFQKNHPTIDEAFNEAYKKELNQLSQDIDDNYKLAVKKMIERLKSNLESLQGKGAISSTLDKDGTIVLPIRPLILAGDDICFVADARIALALVKDVLNNIEAIQLSAYKEMTMRASAGVAMVKVQYPFFRAHELAEELCHNAKAVLSEEKDLSVMDFHVVQGEIAGNLSQIRREQYKNATLTSKPYFLHAQEGSSNTLAVFDEHMAALKKEDMGRGTAKEYRRALSAGEDAARQYVTDKRMDRKKLPESYSNGKCIDFDVLEVMDLYHQLEVE